MAGTFRVGARGSALSVAQTKEVIRFLRNEFAETHWRLVTMQTPGDRDVTTPLERSAPDFFTRDLDDAVRDGRLDCSVHSAKDLPGCSGSGGAMVAEGLDWFWLPVREDPRDAWVMRAEETLEGLKELSPLSIGISSARRRAYAKRIFPKAKLPPIRGAIDDRIRQLIDGRYDALLMAIAGLKRLFRVKGGTFLVDGRRLRMEPISMDELKPPEAQGVLAVTFRAGDERFMAMRSRFVKAVRFVSAGVGDAGLCTRIGERDIAAADVVLHDGLMGELEELLPAEGIRPQLVPVGKRCGAHTMKQPDITMRICDEARKGRRVVRLKGGDAGLFGRLAEETDALERLRIPFVVRPGVSALTAATTGTGMLLTRRGVSCGFTALTPRSTGTETPLVMFMAVQVASQEAARLVTAGHLPETPCAIVFDAAGPHETVWQGTLAALSAATDRRLRVLAQSGSPGLLIVGQAATCLWPALGELAGHRVLLTCSAAVQPHARLAVEDRGGRPVAWPMIALKVRRIPDVERGRYDAIVLTSPSAARIFLSECRVDRRRLPMFFTCGAGTDAELRRFGVASDVMPKEDFSAAGLISEIHGMKLAGMRILRLRSAKAGKDVADALRNAGAQVDDMVLYDNVPLRPVGSLPQFDDVHFASASAVEAFLAAYGAKALNGKGILVMGAPTRAALPPRLRSHARTFATWH